MECTKKKMDKIRAMFTIAKSENKRQRGIHDREEKRYYWCGQCKAYHVTKQEYKKK